MITVADYQYVIISRKTGHIRYVPTVAGNKLIADHGCPHAGQDDREAKQWVTGGELLDAIPSDKEIAEPPRLIDYNGAVLVRLSRVVPPPKSHTELLKDVLGAILVDPTVSPCVEGVAKVAIQQLADEADES